MGRSGNMVYYVKDKENKDDDEERPSTKRIWRETFEEIMKWIKKFAKLMMKIGKFFFNLVKNIGEMLWNFMENKFGDDRDDK